LIEIKSFGSSSAGNCYYITDGRTPLLLEAGIKFKEVQRQLNFQTTSIAGCLISHEHGDHCKAIKEVLKAGINCYMSSGTAGALNIQHHRIHTSAPKQPFRIGTWNILPFDVQHDVAEPYGFLLTNESGEKVLFATDTYYIRYKFKGLTHVLVECNYSMDILDANIALGRTPAVMKKRLMRSHFSLENVKEFLKANNLSKVQEIWLLHLSDSNSNQEEFKKEIMQLTGKMVYVP
jgi:phosphoribosyl 1,2-cyclic phosphodiesterase